MRRIVKEKKLSTSQTQSIASFLRRSWVQVPDRSSASRFMRPLYVSKSKNELDLLEEAATNFPSGVDRDSNKDTDKDVNKDANKNADKDANSETKTKNVEVDDESTVVAISAAYVSFASSFVVFSS